MNNARLFRQWIGQALLVMLLTITNSSFAATMPPLDNTAGRVEDRQQLRALLDAMEKNISALDIDGVLQLMQPDAIVTWQNAEVSRGAEQIRAYYNRMIKSSTPIVKKFSTKATLGGPAAFYSDTAIAYGTTVDTYELTSGLHFTLNANWSTTVVKTNGQWKVAALHFSTNLFDNPLLKNAERLVPIVGVVAFLAGLLAAIVVMRVRRNKGAA